MTVSFDLFDFYRFLLAVVVAAYGAVRLALLAWRWHDGLSSMSRHGSVAWRYAIVLILRARLSRFSVDLLEVVVLAAVAGFLIALH